MKKEKNLNLKEFAKLTKGLSPADIKMIAEEAMKLAIINSKNNISENDIKVSVEKFLRRENIKNNKIGANNG